MVDNNNRKRKEFISEGDIATLLRRYDTMTILKLLQEMAYYAEPKMDWNELVKKTTTGITNPREYQLLWRHLAYRDSLLPIEDDDQDDDSDMECELESSPAVSVDALSEAMAYVKVMAASYVPNDSDIPEDVTVEAPLTINIPYGLHRGPQEPSESYWSLRGMNITFPVSLQKAADGLNGTGLASSMAPRKRRKKWSVHEDEELIAAVKQHGEGSWALIAKEEFEGERTASQLSQRWGAIRRRCGTSNSSTQSGLQRTEAQMAANRALSLAVGNQLPSKKLPGIPPTLSSGSITGAQANSANSGSSLQSQQQSPPVVQVLPQAITSVPTGKSRVTAKKATASSHSRAELMVTANSVAAAACMHGLATAASVAKVEPGKNAVSVLGPKAEPVKTASGASLPRPSGISSALNATAVKPALAASLPRPLGISTLDAALVKTASAASLPRPLGKSPSLDAALVKTTSAASLPHPSGISTALNVAPVKIASVASLPRPTGVISAPKAEPAKTASAASLPRPSGVISAPKAEPAKTTSAASVPRPSGVISAPKAEPAKTASATSLPRPSGVISAPKAEPAKTASAASLPRPSGVISAPKAEPAKTASAASLPRPTGIISAPKAEPAKTASAASLPCPSGVISAPKAEPAKTASAASLPRPSGVISAPKAEPAKTALAASLPCPSGIVSAPKAEPVKTASAVSLPRPSAIISAPKAEPVKSVGAAAATATATNTQVVGPLNIRNAVNGSSKQVISSNKTSSLAPLSKGPTNQNSVSSGLASSKLVPTQRVVAATVIPQKPNVGPAVTATCKPVGVQKDQTLGSRATPLVTTTLQPNKTISTNSVTSTVKLVAAKLETPPSLMPKKNQVPQTEVGSFTDKSSLNKPPEKESCSAVSPLVGAEAESKPKDVATVTGTGQKSL